MSHKVIYPTALKIFRNRHSEKKVLSELMDKLPERCSNLKDATTCLSIGTGYGDYDIDFIEKCLPNLKKFIAIEIDGDCVKEVKENLYTRFKNKFEVEVFEMPVENFFDLYETVINDFDGEKNKAEKYSFNSRCKEVLNGEVDAILAFHIIHFLAEKERKRFYNLCFDHWLRPKTGQLFFTGCDENNSLNHLLSEAKSPVILSSEIIVNELKNGGKNVVEEFPYNCPIDYSSFDVDIRRFLNFTFQHSGATETSIEEAMKVIAPNGWSEYPCNFCIARKA
ncbi:hypothetical protein HELRODRAFT_167267 [Helobdella robusta]|uniref:Uncharacterized protein n=1 Tax=Helobdella robusta TaxID=6412 RepID=T1EZ71_HELRO|nr:hypothetical protein HELRODRAFT_167267 [Helobdella robusta]ESO10769.1 hypothetical protein HELRODRAFT_167267 [Helobdella robusta]